LDGKFELNSHDKNLKNSNIEMLNSSMHVMIAEISKHISRVLKEPSKEIIY